MNTISMTPIAQLTPTFQRMYDAWQREKPSYSQRYNDLSLLLSEFKQRQSYMVEAIQADFGHRSAHESQLADGITVINEIHHLLKHLKSWMKPRRVSTGWQLWPARAEIRPQPVGVVGVISPWNYPINLALIPLATAIAAGNHVYLKPSELSPNSSAFLCELLGQVFPPDRVEVALGGVDIASAFASLPFNHLVFTGSTPVGRKVMAAAAPNLTPLTLELGGKSPAVVLPDFPIELAASRIATGKWFNAGQTCIAPDYVLIEEGKQEVFIRALQKEMQARFPNFSKNNDYTRIINRTQYRRLCQHLVDAYQRGFRIVELAEISPVESEQKCLIPPIVIIKPNIQATIMQEEIFGPILPILTYESMDEIITIINHYERPLALYPFSYNKDNIEYIISNTLAGGITVNDTLLHFAASNLPFGGVGASGMGAYHGKTGFDNFSKLLPILWQKKMAASDLLKPPYSSVEWLFNILRR